MTADPGAEPAALSAPTWTWGGFGVLILPPDSGIPDVPLRWALRSAAQSSTIGLTVGALVLTAMTALGWDEAAAACAMGAFGIPTIKSGHTLAVLTGFMAAAVPCVLLWTAADSRLAGSWADFLGFGLSVAVSSQAGTAAAYLRQGRGRSGRGRHR